MHLRGPERASDRASGLLARSALGAAVGLLASGCTPSPTCIDVLEHDGRPLINVEVDGVESVFMLDTGSPLLMAQPGGLAHVAETGDKPVEKYFWGRPAPMTLLAPVTLRVGERIARYEWPHRYGEEGLVLGDESFPVAGIMGSYPLAHLAAKVEYTSTSRSLCLTGRPFFLEPSRYPEKVFAPAAVGGASLQFLVDSGGRGSYVFRSDLMSSTEAKVAGVDHPVAITPLTVEAKQRIFGEATMDGKPLDGVLGWSALRELDWTWDPLEATFTFEEGRNRPAR